MKTAQLLFLLILISFVFVAFTQEKKQEEVSYSNLNVAQIAGKRLFDLKKCSDCHTLGEEAKDDLTPVTNKRDDDWFGEHVKKESPIVLREEKSKRKQRRILRDEIQALDEFLYHTKPEEREQIESMSENVFQGAYLVYQNNCLNCHAIAGLGKEIAPELTEVANRHDRKWFIANLKDPKQFNEETIMPSFAHLPEENLEVIADYLETLK